jgi:hypothetical protein
MGAIMTTAVHHPRLVWAAAHRMLLIAVALLVAAALATSLTLAFTGSGSSATGSGSTTVGTSPVDINDTCAQVGPATPC